MRPASILRRLPAVPCALALAILVPAPAAAEPFEPHARVGAWGIWFNAATQGCFMEARQGDLVVQMGLQGGADFGFIAAYTEGDAGIAQGEEIAVIIDIDGAGFAGLARGVRRAGADGTVIDGAVTISRSPDFADALAAGETMRVLAETGALVEIDLRDTRPAMESLRACQVARGPGID